MRNEGRGEEEEQGKGEEGGRDGREEGNSKGKGGKERRRDKPLML